MIRPAQDRESRFRRGVEAFRAGRHEEARDEWEALWRDEGNAAHRRFLQALVQVASAVHRLLVEADVEAASRLLDRAIPKLEALPEVFGGIALGRFRGEVARLRAALDPMAEGQGPVSASTLVPSLVSAGPPLPWGRPRPAPPVVPPSERAAYFRRALAEYREGRFFEAHEHWEDLWRDEVDPRQKALVQGLLQVAAAMHKLRQTGGTTAAIHLLERAGVRLASVPDGHAGVAVAALLADLARAKAALEHLAAEERTDLDPSFVPRIESKES